MDDTKKIEVVPMLTKMLFSKITSGGMTYSLTIEKPKEKTLQETQVVVMTGGYRTRLEPFITFIKVSPKPFIPVKGKPITKHNIIDRFVSCGVNVFLPHCQFKK